MIKWDAIIRSSRKTLCVYVDAFGKITVRAPKHCSDERIFAFLQEKEAWILRAVAKAKGAGMRLPPENLDGYSFLLFGRQTEILLTPSKKIVYNRLENNLFLPAERAREKLVKWLKDTARTVLKNVTAQMAEQMGVTYKSVLITSAKTRWGSCSGKNALHYSFRLLYVTQELMEYVVVHELAHTVHKNHSRAFWTLVERYVPDWRERRKKLKAHSCLMYVF